MATKPYSLPAGEGPEQLLLFSGTVQGTTGDWEPVTLVNSDGTLVETNGLKVSNFPAVQGIARSAVVVANLAPPAQTATYTSADFAVGALTELALDFNLTALSGVGTAAQLFMDRKDAAGNYWPVANGSNHTGVGSDPLSLGAGMTGLANSFAVALGSVVRMRVVIGGTTPSATFTISAIGK